MSPKVLTQPFLEENKRFYREVEDYDWVEATDRILGFESFFHRLRERTMLRFIATNSRPGKFLDAGCGTGLLLRHLRPGSVGIDINPRNIEKARRHAPDAVLLLADVEAIPFPDQTFSTILLTEVLEHLPDPRVMLEELWRVLAPGGVVIGSTPRRNALWKLRWLSSTCPGEPFHREFSSQELLETLEGYGEISVYKRIFGMSWVFLLEKFQ